MTERIPKPNGGIITAEDVCGAHFLFKGDGAHAPTRLELKHASNVIKKANDKSRKEGFRLFVWRRHWRPGRTMELLFANYGDTRLGEK